MRSLSPDPEAPAAAHWQAKAWLLLYVFGLTFLFALAVNWANLIDPFVRHDDYPTVFGDEDEYYWKTLSEGRWLNYWYIAKPFVLSTEVSHFFYLGSWSLFTSAFAVHAFGPRVDVFLGARVFLSILIFLSPQAFQIGQWFNTVSIGMFIIALYGVAAVFAPRRIAVLLLLLFVPLSFSAFNTYPFYLLALLLTRVDHKRSLSELVRVSALFIAAFALAMLLTYSLNWYYHGVFGIEVGEWRQPNKLASLEDLQRNLKVVTGFWVDLAYVYGVGHKLQGFAILSIPLLFALVLGRAYPFLAFYALTPVVLGMGLLTVYTLTTGVYVPVRATAFFWIVSMFLLIMGIVHLGTTNARKFVLLLGVFLLIGFLWREYAKSYQMLQIWQESTREFVSELPTDSSRIVMYGPVGIDGAAQAGIQTFEGLSYRLQFLTGQPGGMCKSKIVDCSEETPPFDPVPRFGSTLIEARDGVTYIRFPAVDIVP